MTNITAAAAAAVREALRSRGLRQADLAAALAISQQAISDRLTGRTSFTLEDLEHIAAHFGIPVAELLDPPVSLVDESSAVAS
jgi:transcriptional regulator with XRE-family HTH domain